MAVPFWSGSQKQFQDRRSENNLRLAAATVVRRSSVD
jgi:hypothetical protein